MGDDVCVAAVVLSFMVLNRVSRVFVDGFEGGEVHCSFELLPRQTWTETSTGTHALFTSPSSDPSSLR